MRRQLSCRGREGLAKVREREGLIYDGGSMLHSDEALTRPSSSQAGSVCPRGGSPGKISLSRSEKKKV